MSGLFSKFKGGSGGPTSPSSPSSSRYGKNQELEPDLTPLQRMLQNAGPVRSDGSDKFFGLENFGNTCYCNSIVQALYYSVPFRENVVNYPPHSPHDTPNGLPKIDVPIRAPIQNGGAGSPGKTKGISAQEAMKRRAAINAGQPGSPQIGQRPEDKPDSPEYKKKHAMLTGPVLELTYESASSYGMEESTFTALKDIFMALIANPSRSGVLSPQRFLEIFKRDNEMFRTSMHQDAHEFYGLVLNAVITNVEENSIRLKELGAPKIENGLVPSMKAAVTSAAHAMGLTAGARSPGTGWVHDIFEGVLTSETKCLTCETASQRDETFLDLSIDLEEHSSVTSCLRKFSAEEMLCERNKFHCDNCGGLQEAEKRMKIKKLPKILTLHLKRFKYTEDMTRLQKLFHRVVYPYHLRMFNTTDDTTDPDRLYELYAVVIHIGGNAYHGHYVSVIKTQDRGWLLFDDEMVEPVDKNYVRNFFGDKPGQACAYVLFYQETTVEAMKKEQEAEGLAEVTLASQEAGVALGHPQPNGTYPAAFSKAIPIPDTPLEQTEEFVSLNHAVSAPMPLTHTTSPRPVAASYGNSSYIPPADGTKEKSKEEKAKIQKDTKESEKARKAAEKQKLKEAEQKRKDAEAAEKQRVKEVEQKRKDADAARREEARKAAEENRKTIALSKQTAAEEEERRKKAAAAVAPISIPNRSSTFGPSGMGNENGNHEDRPSGTSLSRSHKYSKSMSRKSFGSFFGKHAEKNGDKLPSAPNGDKNGDSTKQGDDHTALEGDSGPQTPEKHSKPAKDRFSFGGLGRKKSSLIS